MTEAELSNIQAQYCRSDIGIARRIEDIVEGLINGVQHKIRITSYTTEITFDLMKENVYGQSYFSTKFYEMIWDEKHNKLTIRDSHISFDIYF